MAEGKRHPHSDKSPDFPGGKWQPNLRPTHPLPEIKAAQVNRTGMVSRAPRRPGSGEGGKSSCPPTTTTTMAECRSSGLFPCFPRSTVPKNQVRGSQRDDFIDKELASRSKAGCSVIPVPRRQRHKESLLFTDQPASLPSSMPGQGETLSQKTR